MYAVPCREVVEFELLSADHNCCFMAAARMHPGRAALAPSLVIDPSPFPVAWVDIGIVPEEADEHWRAPG